MELICAFIGLIFHNFEFSGHSYVMHAKYINYIELLKMVWERSLFLMYILLFC